MIVTRGVQALIITQNMCIAAIVNDSTVQCVPWLFFPFQVTESILLDTLTGTGKHTVGWMGM